jgi:hypothetical protein
MGTGKIAVILKPTELYLELFIALRTLDRQVEVGAKIRKIGRLLKRVDSGHAGSLTFCVHEPFN